MIAGKNAINDWMGRKQSAEKAHCSVPPRVPARPSSELRESHEQSET